jgi:hypothetical protein
VQTLTSRREYPGSGFERQNTQILTTMMLETEVAYSGHCKVEHSKYEDDDMFWLVYNEH